MEAVIGHRRNLEFFQTVLQSGTLHHAYAFIGPHRVGRKRVAEDIAGKLFSCERSRLAVTPDFFILERGVNEKTGKEKQEIGIAEMRSFKEFLDRRPFMGGYKVAVIDDADKLNEHSANALLKTLEEPAGKTVIFLILEDEAAVPTTILSRCHTVYFAPVSRADLRPMVAHMAEREAEEMLRLSRGAPGRIYEWLESPDTYDGVLDEVARFYTLRDSSFGEKICLIEDLFTDDEETSARERLSETLLLWEYEARRQPHPVSLVDTIHSARRMLTSNVHPRLLMEQVLLSIH